MFLSGLCILLPAVLIKEIGWSSHWEKRTLVADRFAYLVGQGLLLFQQILLRLRQEDHIPQLRRDLAQDLEELIPRRDALQQQITTHKARLVEKYRQEHQYSQSYHRYGYLESGYQSSLFQPDQGQQTVVVPEDDTLRQMRQERNQMNASITDLQQRREQLTIQEQQSFAIRPILEERLEQLAALLNTERQWMQQRGIPIPSNYPTIAFSARASSSVPSMQQNTQEALGSGSTGEDTQDRQTAYTRDFRPAGSRED